ncbi:MAG: polysaccharide pyruvyl transferase CsaB [Clostridiales bacterium]|nr:polysaccharide pyruvyl transferase CsaB [Clostridiales bacterium]
MKQRSILIATMALDIGGAETHVVELSKKLAQFGHRVTVVSNGGIFEDELKIGGVHHIKVPLHTKNPGSLLKSYFLLQKIIISQNIDIVHAHARIPAFLCNFICKKLNVPFVTTVHAEFRTSFLLKAFTRWGSRTLSVSRDINEYLIENYKYDEERASLTVNGINDEVFYPREAEQAILEEFKFTEDDCIISTICRLDKDSSKTPFMLVNSAETLNKKIKNLRIIIVGNGNQFNRLRDKANTLNKRIGREVIILTGARSDIGDILSVTNIFAGISRAALEAMAMEKPVVLCGDFGYLGIMDEESKNQAIETNMTCRGMANPVELKLQTDLLLLVNNKEIRNNNAKLNYRTIREYYTVDKMAEDAISMYQKAFNEKSAPPKYYHAVLSGYYGFDNSGDEAMLASILRELRDKKEDIRLLVLSKKPGETSKRYDVESMARANPISLFRIFGRTGMLISGGGNLIQDLTSFQSMVYYTSLMNYAKFRGLKVMLYANGIGPLIRKSSVKIASRVLNKTDVITVREPNSHKMLLDIGVFKPKMYITADPVISFTKPDSVIIDKILKKYNIPYNSKTVVFSVRPWKGMEGDFEPVFARIADYVYEKYNLLPVFVPLNTKKDTRISADIIELMKSPAILVEDENRARNLVGIISRADLLIGMRLHSLIYAAITGTPVVGVVYDPKVRYFIELMEQEDGGLIEDLEFAKITVIVDKVVSNRALYISKLESNMVMLRKLSSKNASLAIDLLYGEIADE